MTTDEYEGSIPSLVTKQIKLIKMSKETQNIGKENKKALTLGGVSNRFSINKTILSDFALFAIIDNKLNKVVCHLVYDNGEEYCDEMANKMLVGLNAQTKSFKRRTSGVGTY